MTLHRLTTAEGLPVAWCLANPKVGAREMAEDPQAYARGLGALTPGMVVPADKGLAGRAIERISGAAALTRLW